MVLLLCMKLLGRTDMWKVGGQTVEQLKVVIICCFCMERGDFHGVEYLRPNGGSRCELLFWETDRCLLEGADGTCRQGTEACRFFQAVLHLPYIRWRIMATVYMRAEEEVGGLL